MLVLVPGLHNSDSQHWQSLLEKKHPNCIRIEQENWDEPECEKWINQIHAQLTGHAISDCILVGHSIGCVAIVQWFEKFEIKPKGALLVAPSDAEKEGFPSYISGFTPIPMSPLPFPSIVVGSTDDHVSSVARVEEFAQSWDSELIMLENAGHIETKSGFGDWPLVDELIKKLEQ